MSKLWIRRIGKRRVTMKKKLLDKQKEIRNKICKEVTNMEDKIKSSLQEIETNLRLLRAYVGGAFSAEIQRTNNSKEEYLRFDTVYSEISGRIDKIIAEVRKLITPDKTSSDEDLIDLVGRKVRLEKTKNPNR